jgi:hypothetical protein
MNQSVTNVPFNSTGFSSGSGSVGEQDEKNRETIKTTPTISSSVK